MIVIVIVIVIGTTSEGVNKIHYRFVQAAIHAWCDFLEHFNCIIVLSAGCLLNNCVRDNNQGVI